MPVLTMKITPTRWCIHEAGEPVFAEMNTHVEIDDEAAGPFLVIQQHRDDAEKGQVKIDIAEWPHIGRAVEMAIKASKELEDKKP